MSTTAFISSFMPAAFTQSVRRTSISPISHPYSVPLRRLRCQAETDKKPAEATPPTDDKATPNAMPSMPSFEAPSFDTEVFSKFVDNAQAKIDETLQQLQDIDYAEVLASTKEGAIGLVDNALAGDWLNRGELYGAIQIVFVILLLRGPGALDGLVTFLLGPCILILGAGISGKSLWDLGRKQLSVWPAPVPSAELKSDGVYKYVRHPMYAGLLLASEGFAVATSSPARMVLTVAFAVFLAKKIEVEENYLNENYPEYAGYCDKVTSKIVPGIY